MTDTWRSPLPGATALSLALLAMTSCQGNMTWQDRAPRSGPTADGADGPVAGVTPPEDSEPDGADSGGGGDEGFRCDRDQALSTERAWRLSGPQFAQSIEAAFGERLEAQDNPFVGVIGGELFNNEASAFGMPEATAQQLIDLSERLAARIRPALQAETPCLSEAQLEPRCLREAFAPLMRAAYRRDVSDDEVARLAALITTQQAQLGPDLSLEAAIALMIASPEHVFRWETAGATPGRLSGDATATWLAMSLSDRPADAALRQAAARGELDTLEGARDHARRLLSDGLAEHRPMQRFLAEYFLYPQVTQVFKDRADHGYHAPEALARSTRLWLAEIVDEPRFLEQLLTSSVVYVNRDTSESYGIESSSEDFERHEDPRRHGILTQPSFLSAWSTNFENDPIHRGKFIREHLLCDDVPNLPIGVVPQLPETEGATLRERLAEHSAKAECAACHDLMDPLGLPLEAYDDTGRWRELEQGRSVETSGRIVALPGSPLSVEGPVSGPEELTRALARSPSVRRCFIRHAFHYWLGRAPQARDGCSLEEAERQWLEADGRLDALLIALLTSESALYRSRPQ